MEKLNRGKRASEYQKDYLVNYLENNPDIVDDRFMTADGIRFRDSRWKKLSVVLNNLEGPHKTGEKWRKYWRDLKLNTKTKYNSIRESERSGAYYLKPTKSLSLLEEKIMNLTRNKADSGVMSPTKKPEVGFGEGTFLIYDCSESSTPYVVEEVKCEIPEAETTSNYADVAAIPESPTYENTTTDVNAPTTTTTTYTSKASIAATKACNLRSKRAQKRGRKVETQGSKDHVEKLLTVEQKKLKAMELANDLKKEQLQLIKEQTAAIRADTEMKRFFCTRLEKVIAIFREREQ